MIIRNKKRIIILITVALLLLIPLIAMLFTDEENWKLSDFSVAGALLLCTGFMCEFVFRKAKKTRYKIAFCLAILVVFLLVWGELAVGIFGSPFGGT